MPEYYLGSWVWDTTGPQPFWRTPRPDLSVASYDYRSLPQCANRGTLAPVRGLFFLREQAPGVGYYLGDSLGASVNPVQKTAIRVAFDLGENIVASDVLGVLLELLNRHADPTGQQRWKPLRMTRRSGLVLRIGDRLYQGVFAESHPAFANTIAVFQADYRRNKAGGVPPAVLRRWTGSTMQRLWGRMGDDLVPALLPSEYQTDGWERPATEISDNFTRADSTSLGADWTEVANDVEIVSNRVQNVTTNAWCTVRHGTALSTDEHYSQIVVNMAVVGTEQTGLGPMTRFASGANTGYMFELLDSTTNRWRLSKHVTGTKTVLATASDAAKPTGDVNYTIRGDSPGTDVHTLQDGGVEKISQSDTAITGNLPAGFFGLSSNAGRARWDTFIAADLAALLDPLRMMMGVGV